MSEEEFLTIPEAAQELSVGAPTVHMALSEGRLPFLVKYGRKLISRADLDAYKQRTRPNGEKPRGRPRKPEINPAAADISEGVEAEV